MCTLLIISISMTPVWLLSNFVTRHSFRWGIIFVIQTSGAYDKPWSVIVKRGNTCKPAALVHKRSWKVLMTLEMLILILNFFEAVTDQDLTEVLLCEGTEGSTVGRKAVVTEENKQSFVHQLERWRLHEGGAGLSSWSSWSSQRATLKLQHRSHSYSIPWGDTWKVDEGWWRL